MNSKYIKYALGEIVLVVIGILIALALNNFNETRKERAYEIKMLQEVSNALTEDLEVLSFFDSISTEWLKSMRFILEEYQSPSDLSKNLDTLSFHINKISEVGLFAIYNNGPYEAIKSSGMNLISNHEIRSLLAEVYSKDLPTLDIWINQITRERIWNKSEIMDQIFDFDIIFEQRPRSELRITDNEFLKNPQLKSAIGRLYESIESGNRRMRACALKMNDLNSKIKLEIKK
jgi:hypothetical protein